MTTETALNNVFTTTDNVYTTTTNIKDYIDCIISTATPFNMEKLIYGYNCKNTLSDLKPRMFYQAETYGRQYKQIRFGRSKETSIYLMPEFSDVRIIRNKENSPIGVKISFADDTEQKAICMPDDTFSLEHGITICLFKKMLTCGCYCYIDEKYVTGVYNKLVKHAIKVRENRLKAEEEAKKTKEEAKLQEQRFQEKRRKTKAKRAKRASERRINEMAEAIRRSGVVPNIDKIDDGK